MRNLCTPILLILMLGTPSLAETTGSFVQERITLPRMDLIDHHAQRRDLTGDLTEGAIIVINFNYTLCNSICPMGNDVMAQVDDMIEHVGDRPVKLLSITIDPTNDTPLLLNEAAQTFDASEKWNWLTGDPHDIASLLQAVDADEVNIELHDPIFLVGDAERGVFYRSLALPTADQIVSRINAFGS